MKMAEIQYAATGRRKTAVAQVILKPGKGNITINRKPIDEYFHIDTVKMIIKQPLESLTVTEQYDIAVKVNGGGYSGQAGAIRHGIARALVLHNNEFRSALKKEGFLRRDPRCKERKKYGQKGARKRFQFSKR
jgi:small subunit ribosomal protein S9